MISYPCGCGISVADSMEASASAATPGPSLSQASPPESATGSSPQDPSVTFDEMGGKWQNKSTYFVKEFRIPISDIPISFWDKLKEVMLTKKHKSEV